MKKFLGIMAVLLLLFMVGCDSDDGVNTAPEDMQPLELAVDWEFSAVHDISGTNGNRLISEDRTLKFEALVNVYSETIRGKDGEVPDPVVISDVDYGYYTYLDETDGKSYVVIYDGIQGGTACEYTLETLYYKSNKYTIPTI